MHVQNLVVSYPFSFSAPCSCKVIPSSKFVIHFEFLTIVHVIWSTQQYYTCWSWHCCYIIEIGQGRGCTHWGDHSKYYLPSTISDIYVASRQERQVSNFIFKNSMLTGDILAATVSINTPFSHTLNIFNVKIWTVLCNNFIISSVKAGVFSSIFIVNLYLYKLNIEQSRHSVAAARRFTLNNIVVTLKTTPTIGDEEDVFQTHQHLEFFQKSPV
jgi:hypothetical protein